MKRQLIQSFTFVLTLTWLNAALAMGGDQNGIDRASQNSINGDSTIEDIQELVNSLSEEDKNEYYTEEEQENGTKIITIEGEYTTSGSDNKDRTVTTYYVSNEGRILAKETLVTNIKGKTTTSTATIYNEETFGDQFPDLEKVTKNEPIAGNSVVFVDNRTIGSTSFEKRSSPSSNPTAETVDELVEDGTITQEQANVIISASSTTMSADLL